MDFYREYQTQKFICNSSIFLGFGTISISNKVNLNEVGYHCCIHLKAIRIWGSPGNPENPGKNFGTYCKMLKNPNIVSFFSLVFFRLTGNEKRKV